MITLEGFVAEIEGLYTEGLPDENQSSGYRMLKFLYDNPENPVTEYDLAVFHPNLRPYIIEFLTQRRNEIAISNPA